MFIIILNISYHADREKFERRCDLVGEADVEGEALSPSGGTLGLLIGAFRILFGSFWR